jgi:hypothetical protein
VTRHGGRNLRSSPAWLGWQVLTRWFESDNATMSACANSSWFSRIQEGKTSLDTTVKDGSRQLNT